MCGALGFHRDKADGAQVSAMLWEDAPHREDAVPGVGGAKGVDGESQGAQETLIPKQAAWLQ